MKTYTLEQCKEHLAQQGYKHISLQTFDGGDVVKYNPSTVTPDKRFEEIERRLQSPTLPDGYYNFMGKFNSMRDSVPDKYTIVKGDVKEVDMKPTNTPEPPVKENSVLSYKEALKMQNKIAELTANKGVIERERDDYRDKYYELLEEVEEIMNESPEEEEDGELSEGNTGTFLKELVTNLTPIFDRHYDLKEKELEIQEGKVINKLVKAGFKHPQQNGQPAETAQEEEEYELEYPDLSEEELSEMSPEQQSQYHLLQLADLAKKDPERYQQVIHQMNHPEEYQEEEPEEDIEP